MAKDAAVRCSVFIATSADGFIARPDGGLDWLASVQRDGEDYGYAQFVASVDTFVIGRATYEVALGFPEWPYAQKRCVVLTHRGGEARHGERFFAGVPSELVASLGREGARHLYVDGGAVIRQFLAEGLIDELTLSVVPVLLGQGLPLFESGGREQRLELLGARGYESGLTQLRYRVAR
ncbi:MAG: dihydrofolate reductase family protein [Myxococcaceae bacterium]|nr:dihydrofolate reductase family protein [Myxococcaceae bacterium]